MSTRADLDVAILAGDIGRPGDASVRWAQPSEALSGKPVVVVPSNHELYGTRMRWLRGTNVHLSTGDEWVWQGVRFLGATLWTDFSLGIQHRLNVAATTWDCCGQTPL